MKNKATIIIVALIIVAVAIYFYMKKSGNETITSTTVQTKGGLAGLDLSGMFSGLFGGSNTNPDSSEAAANQAANPGSALDYNANLQPQTNYGPLAGGFVV